ncbi:MAG TPA: adenosine kinase [Parvularculaceae bacterium]|nr:adenosine kinase [Parvularculaceae bacterium]
MIFERLDVIGVGNAIVDVIAQADDAFLAAHSIPKGGMILIDETRARDIYAAMAPSVEISGGSAANSIACIASLGGKGGFIGKISADPLGDIFRHDLKALKVVFETAPLREGPGTGRCLINVTSDAQRSMTTFLGAAGFVSPDDIDPARIKTAEITFFEGYLFEQPLARGAFVRACEIAKAAGKRAALTLSDSSCVDRQHGAFTQFILTHVDILLANEVEARTLFQTDDLTEIAEKARALCPLTAVTRSEKGSLLIPREGDIVEVAAVKPAKLVDTTGAGDAYAAGLLLGLSRALELETAGGLGALAAAEVISHFGARPEASLLKLAQAANLL